MARNHIGKPHLVKMNVDGCGQSVRKIAPALLQDFSNPPSLSWRTIAGHRTGGLGLDAVDLAASRSSVVVGGVAGHRTATAVVRTAIDAVDIAVRIISVFSIGRRG